MVRTQLMARRVTRRAMIMHEKIVVPDLYIFHEQTYGLGMDGQLYHCWG